MPNNCAAMAARVTGLVESNCPAALKQPCLDALREMIKGHENYTYRKIEGGHVVYTAVDPSATALAKAAVTEIKVEEIASRKKSQLSIMPKGLLDKLTRDEILDLVAYIAARGKKDHPLFQAGGHGHHHGH